MTSWSTTKNAIEHLEPCYHSNAEEADTRIWLHIKHSTGNRKLIFSPDTNVYHIGLTDAFIASNVLLSPIGRELKLLHLNELDLALQSDSDLQSIPPHKQKEILQVLHVLTGCDFTSFFRWHW